MTDVKFVDTSTWAEQFWLNSGGTRAKKILLDPDNHKWFFKCSEKKEAKGGKPAKHYKYEFWSEIIAYQLGKSWGINVLRYDPAIYHEEIGCLSKSMLADDREQLIEVGRYMTAISDDFSPTQTKTRNEYTFQLLEKTLSHFSLDNYIGCFFQVLLFDAVIGNTDRHQENWAFVARNRTDRRFLWMDERELGNFAFFRWYFRKFVPWLIGQKKFNPLKKTVEQFNLMAKNISHFTPVYDNGSCMARELDESKIGLYLSDDQALNKYIENGRAELHWEKAKLTHFELVSELLKSPYIQGVRKAGEFLKTIDTQQVTTVVNEIDTGLPWKWSEYKIPQPRKDLIVKIINLRAEKLRRQIYDGV